MYKGNLHKALILTHQIKKFKQYYCIKYMNGLNLLRTCLNNTTEEKVVLKLQRLVRVFLDLYNKN
ncbi:hypothetical protein B9Q01_00960 [Candidatus Marsarchaeota G1 archaeon OSP_D]|jgi:hypothetical protein|nr:MAG: hypothetical protein B9Q01_00960 [Candidatus Marsarchaeota G1 archaeon OSP_D]